MWVVYALGAGLSWAISNSIFGINLSQKGLYGAGFPGPASLVLLGIYKLYEQCQVKRKTGHWVDKAKSNYWKANEVDELATEANNADEFSRPSSNIDEVVSQYSFKWPNLSMVFFG